ncbi:MAG: leucyl aminopeptidase family protein, partial [Thermoanaerobaculia bacterium]
MNVDIQKEVKLARLDHLFVAIAEKDKDVALPAFLGKSVRKTIENAGFEGRADESITILAGEPRKITLLGLGKKDAVTIRGVRAALYSIAKIAKKQRDANIAVFLPYTAGGLDAEEMTRLVADFLAQSDYKYDQYVTVKKNGDVRSIDATVLTTSDETKRLREIREEARAIAAGIRTVRDLGNAPPNLITPARLAERAEAVAKESGIKCTVYGRKDIEKMKMGGLLAVNRGSAEEPRFVVMEYSPRRARKHVALVGKGITFDSGGISIKPAEKMEEMKFDMCG